VAPGHERNLVVPDLAADGGNGIAEGAVLFRIYLDSAEIRKKQLANRG
jgi:hypothetical protein